MESFLNRYRNITVLLMVIFGQLLLLAVQVKNEQQVRMIRVWTVTAITPIARVLEFARGGSIGFVRDYILVRDAHEENRRLQSELDKLKLENHFLRNELNTADRAKALSVFQAQTPSRTLAARIIAAGAGANSKVVFLDRGSSAGVQRGMAVVTPDGIVGKIIAAYPTASEVMLVTDSDFAAGVISQKNQVRGTLKGQGYAMCKVDYVPPEQKVEVGEMFFTSGDDRVFPKGFPVGPVKVVRTATPFKEILVEPTGLQHGLEAVLILLQGVHQPIPDMPAAVAASPVYIAPPPPETKTQANEAPPPAATDADRLRTKYKAIGDAQGHVFGEGGPGSRPPDFNLKVPAPGAAAPAKPGQPVSGAPASPRTNPPEPAGGPARTQERKAAPPPAAGPPSTASRAPDPARVARQEAGAPSAPARKSAPPSKNPAPRDPLQ